MDCRQARDRLLQADDPRSEQGGSPDLADHLAGCAGCQSLAADLGQLEETWRAIPLPASADNARLAFLDRLPRLAMPALPLRRAGWRSWAPRWAVAAVLLLSIGLGTWFLVPTPEAQAAPALVERLVNWNLDLSLATSPDDRNRIYAAHEASLRADVEETPLPTADRDLANRLLENGAWLAQHNDPIGEAERFSEVADMLVTRVETAADRKDMKALKHYARLEKVVADHGVSANLERAQESGALNFEHRGRLENVILHDSNRLKALIELFERSPDPTRKEIHKAMDIPSKRFHGSKHKPTEPKPADKDDPRGRR